MKAITLDNKKLIKFSRKKKRKNTIFKMKIIFKQVI